MIAYKVLRRRKSGTLGSLYINKGAVLPVGEWLDAELHVTKGYQPQIGWTAYCNAVPPISMKGRELWEVDLGGNAKTEWSSYTASWMFVVSPRMKILRPVCISHGGHRHA